MVFILTETKARKIFESKYEDVVAFSLGKSTGISEDGLEMSYKALDLLPTNDTVQSVVDGSVSMKKVAKTFVKNIKNFTKPENASTVLSACTLINMLNPDNGKKKYRPTVIVFVLDDNWQETPESKIRMKLFIRILTDVFAEFGITPMTSIKKVLPLFYKTKKKGKKGKIKVTSKSLPKKDIGENLIAYMANKKGSKLTSDGHRKLAQMMSYYDIELRGISLSRYSAESLGARQRKSLAEALIATYNNTIMRKTLFLSGSVGKSEKKLILKRMNKKNKTALKSYYTLQDLLAQVKPDLNLPKVKFSKKDSSKAKKKNGKMAKKFVEFFMKNKNAALLNLVYAHTVCVSLGVQIGSTEYNKTMGMIIDSVTPDTEFRKAFVSAAKAYEKAERVTFG